MRSAIRSGLRWLVASLTAPSVVSICWIGAAGAHASGLDSIGVDPSLADTITAAYFCRGAGEVFAARDTLIKSISVWEPAVRGLDLYPRYLFVTGVHDDSIPKTSDVLWEEPGLVVPLGDGVNPIEYRFQFDPPLKLPKPGKYFLDILVGESYANTLLAVKGDPYPDGAYWKSGPGTDCRPAGVFNERPYYDLCFRVVFQADVATAVPRRSWGRLKILYR